MPSRNSAGTSTHSRKPVGGADWPPLLGGAILAAGTIAVYCRTFSVPLLFDDIDAIAGNLTIRHWSTAFWPPLNTTASGRPVLNLSLAVNYAISGTAVWSYHAVNLAIHVLAGLTLFGIVRRTLIGSVGAQSCCAHFQGRSKTAPLRSDAALRPDATLLSLSAALLWTLHPLQTESVTYVVQRAESLMGLFYLLTLYGFIRGICAERADEGGPRAGRAPKERRSWAGWRRAHLWVVGDAGCWPTVAQASQPACPTTGRGDSWVWFAASAGACLLGMGTKEVMVSAPLMVLLYDRTFVAGSFREAWRRRWGIHAALAATWLLLVGLLASAGWSRSSSAGFDVGITPWAYWLTQFEAVARYLRLSVWPHPLVFEYGTFWVNRWTEVALDALVVAGLALVALAALWRRPVLGFLGAWFFAILAPTSIVPGGVQMIVEHRMYLPLAAVIVAGVVGWGTLLHGPRDHGPQDNGPRDHETAGPPTPVVWLSQRQLSVVRGPVVFGLVVLLLALGLGLLTLRRNDDYRSDVAIWSDTVAKRPGNARAHNNLGFAWAEMPGRLPDAIVQYEAALRLQPDYAGAYNNLGLAWAQTPGRLADAVAQIEAALRLQPDYADAHDNLGNALAQIPGRLPDAIAQYQEALRLKPDSADAHNNLGFSWAQVPGRLPDAIAQYEEALRLRPDFAEAHNNLGVAWAKMPGRLPDAVAQYEVALRLKPDFAEAHNNLGLALAKMPGRLPDAAAQYEEALRLKPDYAGAHNNLGVAWSKMPGRLNEAAAQFAEAVRLQPDYAVAHNNLGQVWSQMPGRLPDAIAQFEEALRLKPEFAQAHYNLGMALSQIPGRASEADAHFAEAVRLRPDLAP